MSGIGNRMVDCAMEVYQRTGFRPTVIYLGVAEWMDFDADEIRPHLTWFSPGGEYATTTNIARSPVQWNEFTVCEVKASRHLGVGFQEGQI